MRIKEKLKEKLAQQLQRAAKKLNGREPPQFLIALRMGGETLVVINDELAALGARRDGGKLTFAFMGDRAPIALEFSLIEPETQVRR